MRSPLTYDHLKASESFGASKPPVRDNAGATRRRRVLLLADACNPEWPSLPIVGYNYARALAEHVDAVVVTQVRNRPNLERAGLGRAELIYLDTEQVAAPLAKLAFAIRGDVGAGWTIQTAMDYPSYIIFERAAWRRLRRELETGDFDLVHRITPMSPALPSPMAQLSPVPFIIGPLNGNLAWPPGFGSELRREREWLTHLRGAYKLLPFHRSTYRHSAAVLAAFEHTIADLPAEARARAINFPEVGIDPSLFSHPVRTRRHQQSVLFAGRLVPYKLPEVVVQAFANSSRLQRHRLIVVGDGPERPRLEALIREHDLSGCVELIGHRPQNEVGELMRQAEIFAFPSIRELGAGVVVEAMACGMACVVVDYGAPAALVGPDRGVKVSLSDKETLVARFTAELEALVDDPDRTQKLGLEAHRHAMAHYTWDAKARKTLKIYDWVLGGAGTRPNFWSADPAVE